MPKRCLIIGGSGFIGRNLIEYLSNNNYLVKVIDRYTENINHLQFFFPTLEIVNLDVNDTNQLIDHLGEIENIIWLIHTSVPSTSMKNIETDLTTNLIPLIKFLTRIVRSRNIEKFIYLSSGGTIYGNPLKHKPIKENQTKEPISSYGLTKFVAEEYINFMLLESNIHHIILRPSNVYGVFQNLNIPQGIIGHALYAAINNHPLTLFSNRTFIRDFIFVTDIADSIMKCLNYNDSKSLSDTFNVGSKKGYSIDQVIQKIEEISNIKLKIIEKPARSFDCTYNILDNTLICSKLGWSPCIDLDQGLNKVWNWMNKEKQS